MRKVFALLDIHKKFRKYNQANGWLKFSYLC